MEDDYHTLYIQYERGQVVGAPGQYAAPHIASARFFFPPSHDLGLPT